MPLNTGKQHATHTRAQLHRQQQSRSGDGGQQRQRSATHSVNTSPLGPLTCVSGRSSVTVVALTCPARALAAASWCFDDGMLFGGG